MGEQKSRRKFRSKGASFPRAHFVIQNTALASLHAKFGIFESFFSQKMSQHPLYTMSGVCVGGGLFAYYKARSLPSLIAGTTFGALFLAAGYVRARVAARCECALWCTCVHVRHMRLLLVQLRALMPCADVLPSQKDGRKRPICRRYNIVQVLLFFKCACCIVFVCVRVHMSVLAMRRMWL